MHIHLLLQSIITQKIIKYGKKDIGGTAKNSKSSVVTDLESSLENGGGATQSFNKHSDHTKNGIGKNNANTSALNKWEKSGADKHSSGAKSTTNKGKMSALNEWENRSADKIIPQDKQK